MKSTMLVFFLVVFILFSLKKIVPKIIDGLRLFLINNQTNVISKKERKKKGAFLWNQRRSNKWVWWWYLKTLWE